MRLSTPPGLLFLFLAFAGQAGARDSSRTAQEDYRQGVERYAQGRLTEAFALFSDAQRLDPGNKAYRSAADRVRAEIMTAAASAQKRTPAAPRPVEREDDDSILSDVLRFAGLSDEFADNADREGRSRAAQGKIAQLLAERRIASARGRQFGKDAELHALSRRLS